MADRSYTLFELHLHDASLRLGGSDDSDGDDTTAAGQTHATSDDRPTESAGGASPLKAVVAVAVVALVVLGVRRGLSGGTPAPAEEFEPEESTPEE
jgi:hypothetical protein